MIYNLIKYSDQTRFHLWDIKITNFKPRSCLDNLLEIFYFYILQTNSSLDVIFYKVMYHHIIYMCDFFCEFRWLFYRDLHRFSRRSWFLPDLFPLCFHSYSTIMNVLTLTATIEINPACTKIMGYILFGAPPMQPWIYKIYVFSVLITKKNRRACPREKLTI